MSITIGLVQTQEQLTTNRERIVLKSLENSNVLIVSTPTKPSTNFLFDYGLQMGRSNQDFYMNRDQQMIATFGTSRTQFYSNVQVGQDLQVGRGISSSTYLSTNTQYASNLTLYPITGSSKYISAIHPVDSSEILTAYANGNVLIQGSVGIGTTIPFQKMTVQGSAYVSQTLTTSTTALNILQSRANDNRIDMSGPTIRVQANTMIEGNFGVTGEFTLTQATVDNFVVRSNILMTTMTASNELLKQPTFQLYQNLRNTTCNLVEARVKDTIGSNHLVYQTTSRGQVVIGETPSSNAMLQVTYSEFTGADTVARFEGQKVKMVMDKIGNVGIGTVRPQHHLHIQRDVTMDSVTPYVGLYDYTDTRQGPFFAGYSNTSPVLQISSDGYLTIGKDALPDPNWSIDVDKSIRSPVVQVGSLIGSPANCNISLDFTTFSNVQDMYGQNLFIHQLTSMSNLITNYFFASNYSIIGLDIFSNEGYFRITLPTHWFYANNIVYSTQESDLHLNDSTASWKHGKVRIRSVEPSVSGETSIGMHVFGENKNAIKISSTVMPNFIMTRSNETVNAIFQSYITENVNPLFQMKFSPMGEDRIPLQFSSNGTRLNNSVQITPTGYMGISLGGDSIYPNLPSEPLHLKGNFRIDRPTVGLPVFYVDHTGNIGINKTSPQFALDVVGQTLFQDNMRVSADIFTGGNVGVGTIQPAYKLHVQGDQYTTNNVYIVGNVGVGTMAPQFKMHVNGDINFDGFLYQNGSRYISSQWTTNPSKNIYIVGSNVGIGTTDPLTAFHTSGDGYISGNLGIGTLQPSGKLQVHQGTLLVTEGSVGIGTTAPTAPLHVAQISYFSANVGIGTTMPIFPLHVGGNINFDGALYQKGTPYISSQWTSWHITGNTSNLTYDNPGNVGIGTTLPKSKLHIEGTSLFTLPAVFDSNVSVKGTLATTGSISSLSDRIIKTDLLPIADAIQKIERLTGYTYTRIDTQKRECGLIAQEVQKVVPELVTPTDESMLSIAYGNMAGLFVQALKEVTKRVEHLERIIQDHGLSI